MNKHTDHTLPIVLLTLYFSLCAQNPLHYFLAVCAWMFFSYITTNSKCIGNSVLWNFISLQLQQDGSWKLNFISDILTTIYNGCTHFRNRPRKSFIWSFFDVNICFIFLYWVVSLNFFVRSWEQQRLLNFYEKGFFNIQN